MIALAINDVNGGHSNLSIHMACQCGILRFVARHTYIFTYIQVSYGYTRVCTCSAHTHTHIHTSIHPENITVDYVDTRQSLEIMMDILMREDLKLDSHLAKHGKTL